MTPEIIAATGSALSAAITALASLIWGFEPTALRDVHDVPVALVSRPGEPPIAWPPQRVPLVERLIG